MAPQINKKHAPIQRKQSMASGSSHSFGSSESDDDQNTYTMLKNSNPSNHLSVEKKDPYLSVQKVDSSNREGTHSSNTRNALLGSMHEMDSLFNLMKGHQDKEKT